MRILLIILLFSFQATAQRSLVMKIKPKAPPPPPDVAVTFTGGDNYVANTVGSDIEWTSADGTNNFCTISGGYLPAGQAGYVYATYKSGNCEEAALKLMSSNPGSCDPNDPWTSPTKYALFPNASPAFYRVWNDVSGFTVTSQAYAVGDLYGLFRAADGTVTAKFWRSVSNGGSGSWVTIHTFSQTSTANLHLGGGGLSYTTLVNPKASPNLQ